jgi:hypothetical protein
VHFLHKILTKEFFFLSVHELGTCPPNFIVAGCKTLREIHIFGKGYVKNHIQRLNLDSFFIVRFFLKIQTTCTWTYLEIEKINIQKYQNLKN